MSNWRTKQIDKYLVLNQELGKGSFGQVFKALYKEDRSLQYACKVISLNSLQNAKLTQDLIEREINILHSVKSPYIVKLQEVVRTQNNMYLFFELCNDGSLKDYLDKQANGRLSEPEAVIFLKHIVEGFKELYSKKIVHRDIKPANILLSDNKAKVADFGLSRIISGGDMNIQMKMSRVGTLLYMSPQVLQGSSFSSKCDVWSLGVMLYEMLYGSLPWQGFNSCEILQSIKNLPLKLPVLPVRSTNIKELITQMLAYHEEQRISWEEIFKHKIILAKETTIKQNSILTQDKLAHSITMNNLYVERRLVQRYLIDIKEFGSIDETEEDDDNTQISPILSSDKGPMNLNLPEVTKQMRKQLLRVNEFILFERNIAIFFNFVLQKIFKIKKTFIFSASDEEMMLKLMFVLNKNERNYLERTWKLLQSKHCEAFDDSLWTQYKNSKDFQITKALIDKDCMHCQQLYEEIYKKVQTFKEDKEFQGIVDLSFQLNNGFNKIYQKCLQNILQLILKTGCDKLDMQQLLLIKLLTICQDPYREFTNSTFDFNQFYENLQHISINELKKQVNKQLD